MDFNRTYGPYSVVTGASAGLGAAFARELAERGLNLVLVARRLAKIEALAEELKAAHGIDVRVVPLDLARDDAAKELARQTASVDVGSVVLNAAQIVIGPFLENDLAKEIEVFRLNTYGPLTLAYEFGQRLKRRGRGGLLFVSSLIAFGAGPYQANYAATKAYINAFAQGLRVELAPAGVAVTVVAPGGMNTEGIQNSGYDFSGVPMMDPRAVARLGLRALGKRALVVPGRMNASTAFVMKYMLPQSASARLFGAVVAKMLAKGRRT